MPYPPQDDTWAWERLIVAKPEMAELFTGWNELGGFAWARILSRGRSLPTAATGRSLSRSPGGQKYISENGENISVVDIENGYMI